MELKRQLGLPTAIFIIIADVIGTGIFMTTGNVLGITGSAAATLALWAVGGLVALTGALCYAELATLWPDDGGEYVYLKKIFGLLPAFLTGWISLVVAFSAAAALSSMTLVLYLNELWPNGPLSGIWAQKITAAAIICCFGVLHITGVRRGSFIQNFLTVFKIMIVFSIIVFGLALADWGEVGRLAADYPSADKNVFHFGFPLLLIMFAYSGWNGASYMAGEIKNPQKNLPRAMLSATVIITVLYLLLNVVYLISTPGEGLMGKTAVGAIATGNLFGPRFSPLFTLGIAFILLTSVSVQMMIGPRVYYAMARDGMIFKSLKKVSPRFGTPHVAIITQMIIAAAYVFIGRESIETLQAFMGFALGFFPLLTVSGLVIVRYRHPEMESPYRTPFFPLVPLIYITLTAAMMVSALFTWTTTSLFAVGVCLAGVIVFFIWQKWLGQKTPAG
ncbi:MAG: amino acid permease [Deltaproteobacteria bacterium]|nr:amino acid permease [Deltaproteobacteria bacterium]